MEIIIHCEECGKNVAVEVENIDYNSSDGFYEVDYICPECGCDGSYTVSL